MVDDLRRLMRGRNVPSEMGHAVLAAAPGLTVSRAATVKSLVKHGANAEETTRKLGVSQRIFERLAAADELTLVLDTGTVNKYSAIDAAVLTPLADRIADRISVGTISQDLGISRHGVEQLCCLSVLEPHHDSAMRAAFADDHVRRSDYATLLRDIDRAKLPWETTEEAVVPISMRQALMTIGGREKPWGPILMAMRATADRPSVFASRWPMAISSIGSFWTNAMLPVWAC
ncbi:hypothetical protein AB5I41_24880 [Sphingomonas sp. MMS24-JH45]